MTPADRDVIQIESAEDYLRRVELPIDNTPPLNEENVSDYIKRAQATIGMTKARTANSIAYILLGGVVLSLPVYVVAIAVLPTGHYEQLASVFSKWYDVVAPLAGAVIGGLFGLSVANRRGNGIT
jgi:hypothetical protein